MVDLTNVDPDVAYSSVPYEKGFALLFYLEQLLGGPGKSLVFSDFFFFFFAGNVKNKEEFLTVVFCSVVFLQFLLSVSAEEICIIF